MASSLVTIRSKKLKRFLFVGPTGAGKSKIVNCCYNRKIDPQSLSSPADVCEVDRLIGKTSSISNYVDQSERKVYVDTVGYGDVRFKTNMESFLLFFRELICYASIGYNWLFLVLRYERLTEDILVYVEMLEQLLGENALARCTIVFTHCKVKNMNRNKCITTNEDSQRIVHMLEKAHSVIFGDMDTFEDPDFDVEMCDLVSRHQAKRRQLLMEQLLERIDNTDDSILTIHESWFHSYWTSFKQYIGYCIEKVFGRSNELSKRHQLAIALKREIPVTIFYESCCICLELIVEIWDTEPKSCMTQCGHIFHYECLKKWFNEKKQCPNCRTDLRNLPERVLGKRIGLHAIGDSPKNNLRISHTDPPTTFANSPSRSATPISGEVEDALSEEISYTN